MREQTLRELAASGAVHSVLVLGMRGGYGISIQLGAVEGLLESSRVEVRLLTLETATRLLRQMGIPRFRVDATNYEPGRMRKPRPDRAEALRKTRTNPRQELLL